MNTKSQLTNFRGGNFDMRGEGLGLVRKMWVLLILSLQLEGRELT